MLGNNSKELVEAVRPVSRREWFNRFFHTEKPITKTVFRPPFCAPEHLFSAVCNGCGECVRACPQGIIELQQHKAVLNLAFSACTFCGKCAEVCSTQALHLSFKKDTQLRPSFANNCLQKKGQACDSCVQSCAQKAISVQLVIDNTLCDGCGECKIACFMNAIDLA